MMSSPRLYSIAPAPVFRRCKYDRYLSANKFVVDSTAVFTGRKHEDCARFWVDVFVLVHSVFKLY